MKKFIVFGITAIAALFASCTKDLTSDVIGGSDVIRGELITVDANLNATRLTEDGTGKLSWSEGDQIAVILNSDGAYAIDSEKYTVNFETGKVTIPENTAYAIYPASMAKSLEGTTLTLAIPDTFTVASAEGIFDYNLMKGALNVEAGSLDFVNLMGYLMVPVTGENELTTVKIKSETQAWTPITGKCTIEITDDAASGNGVKMASNNESFSYAKIEYTTPVDISNTGYIYIPVPAGTYDNLGLVFCYASGANTVYAQNAHSVERGHIKMVSMEPINLANHTPQNPVSVSGSSGNNYNDFASCYIVPPTAGSYSFKTTLVDGTTLKQGVCAEILWSEGETIVYDLHYDTATNTISFKTDGTKGNAMVAFSTNSLESNDIEWFWHIWVTDTPRVLTLSTTGNTNKYQFMDRVVGATWAPATKLTADGTQTEGSTTFNICKSVSESDASDACGLYFQYQNRVPAPRIINVNNNVKETLTKKLANARVAVAYGFAQYAQYWSTSSSSGVIHRSKSNNLLYSNNMYYPYYMYNIAGTSEADGISGGTKTHWVHTPLAANNSISTSAAEITTTFTHGTDGIAYRLWNNKNGGKAPALKTPHDPCPPGYIIEVSNNGYWWADKNANLETIVRNPADDPAFTVGYRVYGIYYDVVDASGNAASLYLPCCGNRNACLINREPNNDWANMGYIYMFNTDSNKDKEANAYAYYSTNNSKYSGPGFESVTAKGVHKTFPGASLQFGARNGGKLAKLSRNAQKTVNAQAYNVRCIPGK